MMKKIVQAIRSNEWWEYKLPPLLAIGYSTALVSGVPLIKVFPHLLFLLAGIFVGAVYVSIINDMTDIEEDAACGKFNRMARVRPSRRWIVPACCIVAGMVFDAFLYPDRLSMLLYALPWLAFTLYSVPPVRLKKRRFWGVLADASGSHFFISLLMVSSTTWLARAPLNVGWFALVGAWSLLYGLRGILFHQFTDRDNDIRSGLATYATRVSPSGFRNKALLILILEMLALGGMIWRINSWLPVAGFVLYAMVALTRQKFFGYQVINILTPRNHSFQIWMGDYYQLFLPLSLLVEAAVGQALGWIVLVVHCLLFPKTLWLYGKEARDLVYRKARGSTTAKEGSGTILKDVNK